MRASVLCDVCPNLAVRGAKCQGHCGKVTVACGLAASGKTTLVAERKQRGDLVWDFDVMMQALMGLPSREHPEEYIPVMQGMRDGLVRALQDGAAECAAWIIVTRADMASEIARQLGGQVEHVEVDEAVRQARLTERRGGGV